MLAIYAPPEAPWLFRIFGFPAAEPRECEFVAWEPGEMARILLPVPANSILGLHAKRCGAPLPPPQMRLVPASHVRLVEVEA